MFPIVDQLLLIVKWLTFQLQNTQCCLGSEDVRRRSTSSCTCKPKALFTKQVEQRYLITSAWGLGVLSFQDHMLKWFVMNHVHVKLMYFAYCNVVKDEKPDWLGCSVFAMTDDWMWAKRNIQWGCKTLLLLIEHNGTGSNLQCDPQVDAPYV